MAPKSKIPTALPRSPNTSPPKPLPVDDKARPGDSKMPGRFADFFKKLEDEKSTEAPASPSLKVEGGDRIARTPSRSPSPTKTYLTKFHTTPVQQDPEVPDPDVTGSWSMLSEMPATSPKSKPSPPGSPTFLQDPVTGAFAVEVQEHGAPADVATPEIANGSMAADGPASVTLQGSEHVDTTQESPNPGPIFSSTFQEGTSSGVGTQDENNDNLVSRAETFSPVKFANTSSPAVRIFSGYGDNLPQRNFTFPSGKTGSPAPSTHSSASHSAREETSEPGEIDVEKMADEITAYFMNNGSSDGEEDEERLPGPRKLDQEEEDDLVGETPRKAESDDSSSDDGVALTMPTNASLGNPGFKHDFKPRWEQVVKDDDPIMSKILQEDVFGAVVSPVRQAAPVADNPSKEVQKKKEDVRLPTVDVKISPDAMSEADSKLKIKSESPEVQSAQEIDMTPDTGLDWGGALKSVSPVRLPATRKIALPRGLVPGQILPKPEVFQFGAHQQTSAAAVDPEATEGHIALKTEAAPEGDAKAPNFSLFNNDSAEDKASITQVFAPVANGSPFSKRRTPAVDTVDNTGLFAHQKEAAVGDDAKSLDIASPSTKSKENEASTPSSSAPLGSSTADRSFTSNRPVLEVTANDLPEAVDQSIGSSRESAQLSLPVDGGSDDGKVEDTQSNNADSFDNSSGSDFIASCSELVCTGDSPSEGTLFSEGIAGERSSFDGGPSKTQLSPRDDLFDLVSHPSQLTGSLQDALQNPALTLGDLQVALLYSWSLLQATNREYGRFQAGDKVSMLVLPFTPSDDAIAMPFYDIFKVSVDNCTLAISELVETRTALESKMAKEMREMGAVTDKTELVEQRAEAEYKLFKEGEMMGRTDMTGDAIFTVGMLVFLAILYMLVREA